MLGVPRFLFSSLPVSQTENPSIKNLAGAIKTLYVRCKKNLLDHLLLLTKSFHSTMQWISRV